MFLIYLIKVIRLLFIGPVLTLVVVLVFELSISINKGIRLVSCISL